MNERDVHIKQRTIRLPGFTIRLPGRTINLRWRKPRRVLLLNPFQLPLVLCLTIVSVVFTIWPEVLEHSAISFETRGVIHHVWHLALLGGSMVALFGMFEVGWGRIRWELLGLLVIWICLGLNLVAVISADVTGEEVASGIGLALRVSALLGLTTRLFILAREPILTMPPSPDLEPVVDGSTKDE